MATWIVFLGRREIDEVEAPDKDIARAKAWARWGTGIEVQSKVEHGIAKEERSAIERDHRRKFVDSDEDSA